MPDPREPLHPHERPKYEDLPFNSPRRWAARLAFPLLILGGISAWKAMSDDASDVPDGVWWGLAVVAVILGLALARLRYR